MSAPPQALLSLRQWRVAFRGTEVVHGIDLDVAAGERLALVGESGSGKTVTALGVLRLLGSAQLSGQCWFDGEDLMQASEARMQQVRGQHIAMVFQEPMTALNPLFTIGDQLAEVFLLKMAVSRQDAWQRCADMLRHTGGLTYGAALEALGVGLTESDVAGGVFIKQRERIPQYTALRIHTLLCNRLCLQAV